MRKGIEVRLGPGDRERFEAVIGSGNNGVLTSKYPVKAAGVEPETAADLADAITQWVGFERKLRKPDELEAEYQAAGLDYAPPETPLESEN